MTFILRPKLANLYQVVQDFYLPGNVRFVAHVVRQRTGNQPNVTQLKPTKTSTSAGHAPSGHPDQEYWADITSIDTTNLVRIELDCTLIPCANAANACLFQVPLKIKARVNRQVPIRFYSHKAEFNVPNDFEKGHRYFDCHSHMSHDELTAAYRALDDQTWKWAHLGTPGVDSFY